MKTREIFHGYFGIELKGKFSLRTIRGALRGMFLIRIPGKVRDARSIQRFFTITVVTLFPALILFTSCGNNGGDTTTQLAAPTDLTGAIVGGQIDLTWMDNSADETGFEIEMGTSFYKSGLAYNEIATVGTNVTNYSVIWHGGEYDNLYFRVRAYNSNGYSAYSNVFSTPPPYTPVPPAPTNLAAVAISSSEISLSWTVDSQFVQEFIIEYSVDPTFNGGVPGGGTDYLYDRNATSYTVEGLAASTTYYFRIMASNYKGGTYSNTASAATLPAGP